MTLIRVKAKIVASGQWPTLQSKAPAPVPAGPAPAGAVRRRLFILMKRGTRIPCDLRTPAGAVRRRRREPSPPSWGGPWGGLWARTSWARSLTAGGPWTASAPAPPPPPPSCRLRRGAGSADAGYLPFGRQKAAAVYVFCLLGVISHVLATSSLREAVGAQRGAIRAAGWEFEPGAVEPASGLLGRRRETR